MVKSTSAIAGVVIFVFLLVIVAPLAGSVIGPPNNSGTSTTDTTDRTREPMVGTTEQTGTSLGVPTNSMTATPTPIPTGTPTATDSPTQTVTATSNETISTTTPEPDLSINQTVLEAEIEAEINEYRVDNGYDALNVNGTTVEEIRAMARNHSEDLRADGSAWNIPDNYNIIEMYESHDLYWTCIIEGEGDYVVRADNGNLMAVQKVDVSSENEGQIADSVMDNWSDHTFHGDKFEYPNAERVGVGLTIDARSEHAYVAMSIC